MQQKYTLLFVALLLSASSLLATAPINDNCANASAIIIAGGGYTVGTYTSINYDLTNATIEPSETFYSTISSAGQNRKSVWFKFSLPTARRCTLFVKQPTPVIAGNDVGFTVYKANACFPTSAQADSALLAAQTVFGYSTNPCMKPGDYMVQVSSNNNANGPIFIQLQLDTPSPAPYDYPDSAFSFGVLSSCDSSVKVNMGCQSLDDASEACTAFGANYLDYTQSVWFTFTTPAYLDWLGVRIGPSVGCCFSHSPTVFAYNLYQGNTSVTPLTSLTPITTCTVDTFFNNSNWVTHQYECSLLPNTTYSVQLFFHKEFKDIIQVQIPWMGIAPSGGPKPLAASVAASNKLGILPAGTTTANDNFGCNSRLSVNACGQTNPAAGVHCPFNGKTYTLNDWFTFELTHTANLTITTAHGNWDTSFCRLFNKDINASCTNIDTTINLYAAFLDTGRITCVPPGKYSLQLLGRDDFTPNFDWACAYKDNLGQPVQLSVNVMPIGASLYSLTLSGMVDTVNAISNTYGDLQDGITYNSGVDTFGCNNTVLPDTLTCNDTSATKAMYFEFKIGDANNDGQPDSGVLSIYGNYSWDSLNTNNILYRGDANALANSQNRHAFPSRLSGLTPITPCFGVNPACTFDSRVCVTPGIYTMVTFGDSTLVGQTAGYNFTENLVITKHRTGALAQNLGNIHDSLPGREGVLNSDTDYFSCIDNAVTIGGKTPCGRSFFTHATKAIYREFYLDTPTRLTIQVFGNPCHDSTLATLFYGKASNGLNTLTSVGSQWSCFNNQGTGSCHLLPVGWYTVVTYGEGPTYSNPSSHFNGARGYGNDVGMESYLTITVQPDSIRDPRYNRPHKSCIDTNTYLPFVIQPALNGGTPTYPQTDTTYNLYWEHYNCLGDTPFSLHPLIPCANVFRPHKVTYYTFSLPQPAYIHIFKLKSVVGQVFPFDVRTDSALMLTTTPVQPCLDDGDYIEICNLLPGTYTLVIFPEDTIAGDSIAPSIYVDAVGYSRFDFAKNAYDFGLVPMDSAWHSGKVGDVNPLNPNRAASDDFFYCTTGSSRSDPTEVCGSGNYNALVYGRTNNAYYYNTFSSLPNSPRRNLWYTFVLDKGGKCTVAVNQRTPDKQQQNPFVIYKSSVNGNLPFSTIVSSGLVDSTYRHLTKVVNNNPDTTNCTLTNQVSFGRNACSYVKERYYILVENPGGQDPNSEVDVQILYDTIPAVPTHYDHYSQANVINGLNQAAPPYTNLAIDTGLYHGGTDNFSCATFDTTDYNPCNCADKDVWYKFTVNKHGFIRLRYTINGVDQPNIDNCQIVFLQQTVPGDSTRNGLVNLGVGGSNLYDPRTNLNWYQTCIYPGTYYLLMTGCNRTNETVQPFIQFVNDSTKYDHYYQANVINGLNQSAPPYTNTPVDTGTYYGVTDNLTCATFDATDYNPCSCADKDVWYKFTINHTGYIRLRYTINGVNPSGGVDGCQMVFMKEAIAGDSTSTGLINQGLLSTNYYDARTHLFWYQTCITPGTYYILMTGCNLNTESVQPIIQIVRDSAHYDHYSTANVINGLNQTGPPYSNIPITATGIYSGAIDNFTCATFDTTDYAPCGQPERDLWYKVAFTTSGSVRLRYNINGASVYNVDSCQILWLRQIIPGDSTRAGLTNMGPVYSTYYDYRLNRYWYQTCVSPGTYYILMTGLNRNLEDVQPFLWFQTDSGDYCSAPVSRTLNGAGSVTMSTVIDCHTIGDGFGEDGSNMGCLIPAGSSVTQYKSTWFSFTITGTDTFDITPTLTNNTTDSSNNVRYRLLYGTCAAMNTGSCFSNSNTVNTFNCLAAGTYYIQVVEPVYQLSPPYNPVTGTINLQINAVRSAHGCIPVNNCFVVANFAANSSCYTDSVHFLNQSTAGDSIRYHWDFGFGGDTSTKKNPVVVFPNPLLSQSYSVLLVVNNPSCNKTDSIRQTITVRQKPHLNLGSDTSLCTPNTLTLHATTYPGTRYLWMDGNTDSVRTVTLTGQYIASDSFNGCSVSDTINITINHLPTAILGPDTTLCPQQFYTVNLSQGFGEHYLWNNGYSGAIYTTDTAGVHSVEVSVGNCIARDTIVITTIPAAHPIHNDTIICNAATLLLHATTAGASAYSWDNGTTDSTRLVNASGIYWVNVTVAICTMRDSALVHIPYLAPLLITGDSLLCASNDSSVLDAGAGFATYNWSNGITTRTNTIFTAGTYWVTVANTFGCQTSDSIIINVSTPIVLTTIDTNVTCFNGTNGAIYLNPSGGTPSYTFNWSNLSLSQNQIGIPSGTYYVTVTDANQCVANDSAIITQPTQIAINLTPIGTNCFGTTDGGIQNNVTGGTPAYTYQWSNNSITKDLTNIAAGFYFVTVTDSSLCSATAASTVTAPDSLSILPTVTNSQCFGQNNGSIVLTVHGGTLPYQFAWADNVTTQNRRNLTAGLYAVTLTDAHHCTDTASATILELNKLALTAILVNPSCPPLANGSIQLFASGSTPPYHYRWSNAAATSTLTNLPVAIYAVTVTDSVGCVIDSAFTLQYNFVLSLNTITAQTIKLGDSISLTTTTNGTNLSYIWTPTNALNCFTCANPVAMPTVSTTYQVVGTTDSGCVASDTVTITVIPFYDLFIPNVFSPNNDGNNDFWELFGNKAGIKQLHVQIFDRWGEKVFDSSDPYYKWDGRYKGELVTPGVFVYTLQVTFLDHHVENNFKGSITVVR